MRKCNCFAALWINSQENGAENNFLETNPDAQAVNSYFHMKIDQKMLRQFC